MDLSNFIRAKMSTHTLLIVGGALIFAMHKFFSDPNAARWLMGHWVVKDLMETAEACLMAYGIYKSPTTPSA